MAESVFEAVKQSVTVREAAQMYGIEVNRSGMACCPFHDDKNPSMKLNEEYFYCFGCGATGDVIDFKKELLLPKKQKQIVLRDLEEMFASAKEHGESEQQVIERLGAPKEFVINTEEQFGVDHASVKKRRGIIHIVSSVIVAVVAFIVFGVMQLGKTPDNVIGQADAMTNIKIDEVRAIDPSFIFLLIGTVAIILIFFQMITFMRNNRRK